MQGKQLRQLEAELWRAADQLRANSKLTATEYSMPVLGLIFLRHAYNRFIKAKEEVENNLPIHPKRGKRPVNKNDFLELSSMYLPEMAQYEYLVNLPESVDIGEAIDNAMKLIEDEYENLRGVLPKNFSIFGKDLLRELLRIFNKEVLQKAEGDLFGKIYEYFLNKFAMTGAQEGGEFFTPMSLVQTIVNVIEPDHGIVFDPACGSAGMFVQTGYFIESKGLKTAEKVTFYGQEKAALNTKLAKMNLTVHGLEGNIQEGNTFYEDKHNLYKSCDFVMANPPFNVDGVDKAKDSVKNDARLAINGIVNLPKNDNANYLWIQYFYNYLKDDGRAGFVMASSASDAGHSEKEIREKLVRTGAVDVMMAIGNNFFYTRSLPCTLWFFNRAKEADKVKSDQVLMLDARKIYRKVTSKVNDFSPEQLSNLIAIVGLYRGQSDKFTKTLQEYRQSACELAEETKNAESALQSQIKTLLQTIKDADKKFNIGFGNSLEIDGIEVLYLLQTEISEAKTDAENLESFALLCKSIRKSQDKLIKQIIDLIADKTKELQLNKNKDWKELNVKDILESIKLLNQQLSGNPDEEDPGLLHETEYFFKQAQWLTKRFPDGKYQDVEGLCKVVSQKEIEAKDWSLSPGRYVGVDAVADDDFDYEERLKEIHIELEALNEEAVSLTNQIFENFKNIL